MSQILQNVDLAPLTSFGVGGPAQAYLKLDSSAAFKRFLRVADPPGFEWLLGSATNVLISDRGLDGTTWHFAGGRLAFDEADGLLLADAGAVWDDLVVFAVARGLWGVELMSGIPGTVGGAAAININAYGQALADVLAWVEVYDPLEKSCRRIAFDEADWGYKRSPFADGRQAVLSLALKLEKRPTTELRYGTALKYAADRGLDAGSLAERRQIILGVRAAAGSLLDSSESGSARTCGSFFKNPVIGREKIEAVIAHEETNLTAKELLAMNRLHGGSAGRVSAAHVLLAAGFKRGQRFGRVRLHPDHVLKVENFASASAQEIYDTARLIQKTVKMRLDIDLEFEVKTMGVFDDQK
ncbi:FAD-binding protein [Candidatus Saccharibacteria bacterium]|nr:FAD-binding protein [Candidatus Saccharibacteria bacterium]